MKEILTALFIISGVGGVGYRLGYAAAQTRFERDAAHHTRVVTDAVSRASGALSEGATGLSSTDALSDAKLKEIENETRYAETHCLIPADSLRSLDAIGD
jgi:CHASE1-domain containing sensor protein